MMARKHLAVEIAGDDPMSFNGAAPMMARKRQTKGNNRRRRRIASMEPRQ